MEFREMKMTVSLWVLLLVNVAIGVLGQVLLKSALTNKSLDIFRVPGDFLYLFFNWKIFIAVICYFINLVLYLVLLSRLNLGYIFALQVSFGIIFVSIAGIIIFADPLKLNIILGNSSIGKPLVRPVRLKKV